MSGDADALPVPHDLRPLLQRRGAVDWGQVAWDAVRARAAQAERAEGIAQRSRLRAPQARALAEALRGGP